MRDLTLMRKNLFRKKLRFTLLFISILIAFLLYGMLVGVKTLLDGGGDAGMANRMVATNKINFTQPLPISYLNRVRAIEGVKAATHTNWFGGYFQEQRNFMLMFSTEPESYFQVYPELVLTPAERESFLKEKTGILVGKALADKYGWRVGQKIPVFSSIYAQKNGSRSWNFIVSGIFTSSEKNNPTNFALINWTYFNENQSYEPNMTGTITFLTENASMNDIVKQRIDTLFTNSQYATDTVTEKQFGTAFASQLGNLGLIITFVVGAAFLTILIIVGNTMVMAVRERTREIGIMKTLGFPAGRIMRLIVGESLLIALIGGCAGLGLATLFVAGLSAIGALPGLSVPGSVWISGIAWMLLLGLLTAAIPVYNAMKLNIVTALGRK
jgi:putative ABC transport system permease protein